MFERDLFVSFHQVNFVSRGGWGREMKRNENQSEVVNRLQITPQLLPRFEPCQEAQLAPDLASFGHLRIMGHLLAKPGRAPWQTSLSSW